MLDKISYSCYNKLYSNEETINLTDSDGNDQKKQGIDTTSLECLLILLTCLHACFLVEKAYDSVSDKVMLL